MLMLASASETYGAEASSGHTLTVQVMPDFGPVPFQFGAIYTNAAGQPVSVTRLDFLLSDFELHQSDGAWAGPTNWQAYLSLGTGRSASSLPHVPTGLYDRVRFHVGVRPELNHADPARFPAGHPLNPELNGMHWGWQGGYVFFAWEGRWRTAAGKLTGYSFHLGNDTSLMTVELPVRLALSQDEKLPLVLRVDRLFEGHPPLLLAEGAAATHSRPGDLLAVQLRGAVEKAFAPGLPISEPIMTETATPGPKFLMAKNATPYRFTFARQFPPPPLPRDNPLTEEGVELGHRLFEDTRLSINGAQSCATCHQAAAAFTDAGRALSAGAEGPLGTRNAIPLFNLAWKRSFFWDGRAASLREQVLMPIQNPMEMHSRLTTVVGQLAATADYPPLFAKAFGSTEINADRLARALEQFLLSVVSYQSKFDRAMQGREQLTEQERRGFELFITEYDPRVGLYGADCFHCHGGPFFTNHRFANNGLDLQACDPGLEAVTGRKQDHGRFAVPSLRNVAVTGPYMHDGRFKTLEEVIEHYRTGVKRTATLDPNLARQPEGGIPLSEADKKALVAFLKTLTDEVFVTIYSESEQARRTNANSMAGR